MQFDSGQRVWRDGRDAAKDPSSPRRSQRTIRTHADGDVRTVTLDRPERRNALTPAGLDQLEAAVVEADEPVVQLRGAGSAFCTG